MKEKIRIVLLYTLPWLLYFASSYFSRKNYSEFALQGHELCLKQTIESNLPISVCGYISSASNSAFFTAASIYSPTIVMLIILVIGAGHKILQMDKEIKGLKEKLNV